MVSHESQLMIARAIRPLDLASSCLIPLHLRLNQSTTSATQNWWWAENGYDVMFSFLSLDITIAKFEYTRIEEVDPVDGWAIVGSIGGVWREWYKRFCHLKGLVKLKVKQILCWRRVTRDDANIYYVH